MKNIIILSSLVLITLFSCGFNASKYYTPTEANSKKANTSIDELIAGRTAYINKCNECHRLYKPDRHSAEEWTMYLNEMQERAEVSDASIKQIYLYLTAEIIE